MILLSSLTLLALPAAAVEHFCDERAAFQDLQQASQWQNAERFFRHVDDASLERNGDFLDWIFGPKRACKAPSVCAVLNASEAAVQSVPAVRQTDQMTYSFLFTTPDFDRSKLAANDAGYLSKTWGVTFVETLLTCDREIWSFDSTPFYFETSFHWVGDYGR